MDKSGRILIPTVLRESAQMTGEVAVLGYLNYLDIWNNERFRKKMDEQVLTDDDHSLLGV
jgi:MraZ protein